MFLSFQHTLNVSTVMRYKACPVQFSFKEAESDKYKMAEHAYARQKAASNNPPVSPSVSSSGSLTGLPPLKYLPDDNDGWTTWNEPLLYVYAGKGPYVGR